MAETRRQLKLAMDGDYLYVSRFSKDRKSLGKRAKWKVGARSYLPRPLYFLIHSFARRKVDRRDDNAFPSLRKAVLAALCEAARACGCEPKFGCEGGDVCWYLDGGPFFAFQIHKGELDKQRAVKLRKGRAMFRWVIVVGEGGYVRYHPRKTLFGVSMGTR